ncbi:MAG: aminopeptidase P family protein [Acidobacteriota bacterium]|nr:MAG: aminopeptidase P family protein [Acidobacteriota bacterium]
MRIRTTLLLVLAAVLAASVTAQDKHYYQTDFTKEEFAQRRARIYDAIGNRAVAVVQGARDVSGFAVFRQSNTFYYLTGLETARSYLLLDGRNRTATVYLPHRDEDRERSEGKSLSVEDAELVKNLTGIDSVQAVDALSDAFFGGALRPPAPVLYTPMAPAELGTDSRDELLRGRSRIASDPWDGQPSRESHFIGLIKERFPQFEVRDLTPILDAMRLVKSEKEIELIREATRIAGLAIIEAMRSTEPGVYEYQLDAAAKYIFHTNGARGEGYASIIGGGVNAYFGHYFRKTDKLVDGDLLLMDFAPDYRYYTSDVTRMWPVNGRYTEGQRQLCEFVLMYRNILFAYVRPGVTSDFVLDSAAKVMEKYLEKQTFVKPEYERAVRESLKFRGHFQHSVGMAVHDVGTLRGVKLEPGMIFTIDPMIWVPEEKLYVRIEDMALVTKDGVENLSEFVPSSTADIELTIAEPGIVQFRPAN